MKEENRKYAREAMDIVEHAAHKIGSRLPGSDGEIKLHKYMGEKLREIGIEPKTEEFAVSPRSGIGGLGYAGWSGVIISIGAIIAIACGFSPNPPRSMRPFARSSRRTTPRSSTSTTYWGRPNSMSFNH